MANIAPGELLSLLQNYLEIQIDADREKKLNGDELTFKVTILFAGHVVTADHHTLTLPPLD